MRAADLALRMDQYNRSTTNTKTTSDGRPPAVTDKDPDQKESSQSVNPVATLSLLQESSAAGKALFDAHRFLDSCDLEQLPVGVLIADRSGSSPQTRRRARTARSPAETLAVLATQLCCAEGKFRQLNAIKEGLDIHLVKQAHCLLLLAKDLHYELGDAIAMSRL